MPGRRCGIGTPVTGGAPGPGSTLAWCSISLGASVKYVVTRAAAAALAIAVMAAGPAASQEGEFLALGFGAYDISSDDDVAAEWGLEYRFDGIGYNVAPMLGVMFNTDASVLVYGGLFLDLDFGNWVVTPSFAVGAYRDGDDTDDRYGFDYRSGVELAYRLANRSRLGIAIHHISNLDLAGANPNANSLVVTYAIPLGRF